VTEEDGSALHRGSPSLNVPLLRSVPPPDLRGRALARGSFGGCARARLRSPDAGKASTIESNKSQHEHNYFTTQASFFERFRRLSDRKWPNAAGCAETKPLGPLPPGVPSSTKKHDYLAIVGIFRT
jgi:hypothetical protein